MDIGFSVECVCVSQGTWVDLAGMDDGIKMEMMASLFDI